MQVRYTFLERNHPSSMSRVAEDCARAVNQAGVQAEAHAVKGRYGSRVGGRVLPAMKFLLSSYDGKHLYHAVEPEVAFRGVSVVTYHILYPFFDRTMSPADRRWGCWRYRKAAERARRIVAINPAIAEEVREILGERAFQKTRVVRFPLKIPPLQRLPTDTDVLWTGGNHPRKGPAQFLESLLHVRQRLRVSMVLHQQPEFVQENAKIASLLPKVRERHTLSMPKFPVPFEELDRLYRSSQVYVNSSYYEGFPAAAFEAYARGARLVVPRALNYTTDYGKAPGVFYYDYDCRSVTREGKEDPGMPERLASAIESALAAGPVPPEEEVLGRYREPHVAAELARVYRELD